MQARVLVLADASGAAIRSIDISDLDNANSAAPMVVIVETRCDLGEWHEGQRAELVPWGKRISEPS